MSEMGKTLVGVGVLLIVVGGALWLSGASGGRLSWLGRLPGDIHIQRDNWSFSFPLTTCLLISAVLTLVLLLFSRR